MLFSLYYIWYLVEDRKLTSHSMLYTRDEITLKQFIRS